MRLRKIFISVILFGAMLLSGCGGKESGENIRVTENVDESSENIHETGNEYGSSIEAQTTLDKIDMAQWLYNEDTDVYWQTGIQYCGNPADAAYENLGIYVPGAYMIGTENGDGTYTCEINASGSVGEFTAQTAPIVIPVDTPGYAAMAAPTGYASSTSAYTDAGFVYVYAGCRGRDAGAPAGVTDLKAAIRYIRYNEGVVPGSTDRIFSFGMSGGGAQSALLGATGDSDLYTPYLELIGAVSGVSDGVAGSMCWCPITNLDYASEAYEWNLGVTRTNLEEDMQALSDGMAQQFALYINELELKDENGSVLTLAASDEGIYQAGSYYDYLKAVIETSLNNFLQDTEFPYTAANGGRGGFGGFDGFGGREGLDGGMGFEGKDGLDGDMGFEGKDGLDGNAGFEGNGGPDGNAGFGGTGGPDGNVGFGGTGGLDGDMGFGGNGGPDGDMGFGGNGGPDGNAGFGGTGGPDGDRGFEGNDGLNGNMDFGGMGGMNGGMDFGGGDGHGLDGELLERKDLDETNDYYDRDGIARNDTAGGISLSGTYETVQDYIDALNAETEWVIYDSATNTATIRSIADFVCALKAASKDLGAFDALNESQGENILFGDGDGEGDHFDAVMAGLLVGTDYEAEFADDLKRTDALGVSVAARVNMYNPLYYLCNYYEGYKTANVASHWRIRTGINQSDTALTTEVNLALALENYGADVDFETVWGQAHVEAERVGSSTDNFIKWVKECCR